MKKICSLLLLVITFYYTQPAFSDTKETQLESREYQTKKYDVQDTKTAMKSVINAFQDQGYTVKVVDSELGFITAKQEFQRKETSKALIIIYSAGFALGVADAIFTFGTASYLPVYYLGMIGQEIRPKHHILDATASLDQFGNQTKIRVTFAEKVYGKRDGKTYGKETRISTIHIKDQKTYQNFFAKIDKSAFNQN